MAELAIMGSIALVALGLMIRMGLLGNFTQEVAMASFRRALVDATYDHTPQDGTQGFDQPRSVAYREFRARQVPDPGEGFGIGLRQITNSGAQVIVSNRLTYAADGPGCGIEDAPADGTAGACDNFRSSLPKTVVMLDRSRSVFFRQQAADPFISDFHLEVSRNRDVLQSPAAEGKLTVGGNDTFMMQLGPGADSPPASSTPYSPDYR